MAPINRGSGTAVAPLPAGFAGLPATQATPNSGASDAFLWFASKKSKQWDEYAARVPGVVEGDAVYVSPAHCEIIRVMKFHLVTATQYWARKNKMTGQPEGGVRFDDPGDKSLEEYIDAVLLVQTTKGLLPARCRFKSGLIGAINPALKELKVVTEDLASWSSRSAAHEAAAKLPVPAPYFRFICVASFKTQIAKSTGMPYQLGRSTCQPVAADDVKMIAGLSDPAVEKLCTLVAQEHLKRLDAVKKLPA